MAALDSWPARSFARRRGNGPSASPGMGAAFVQRANSMGCGLSGTAHPIAATLTMVSQVCRISCLGGSQDFFGIGAEPTTPGDVFLATGAQNPPSASLTRQSRFDPRSPQAAGHFFLLLARMFYGVQGVRQRARSWSLSLALAFARHLRGWRPSVALRRSPSLSVARAPWCRAKRLA